MVLPLGCTSGKEKRNLDHIKRIASAQARRANPLFVSEEFEHTALVQCPPKCAHLILQSLSAAVCLTCLTHFALWTRSNHHYEDRTRGRGDMRAPPGARVHRR